MDGENDVPPTDSVEALKNELAELENKPVEKMEEEFARVVGEVTNEVDVAKAEKEDAEQKLEQAQANYDATVDLAVEVAQDGADAINHCAHGTQRMMAFKQIRVKRGVGCWLFSPDWLSWPAWLLWPDCLFWSSCARAGPPGAGDPATTRYSPNHTTVRGSKLSLLSDMP